MGDVKSIRPATLRLLLGLGAQQARRGSSILRSGAYVVTIFQIRVTPEMG
jgi:hypothetical protein